MFDALKSQLGHSIDTMRHFLQRPAEATKGGVRLDAIGADERRSAREEKRRRLHLMRRELYQLLERHPSARQLMRHLDLVERSLRSGGFAAVQALPTRVVAAALVELERLVWDWSPIGLAELRSRMAVLVKHELPPAPAAEDAPVATAPPEVIARRPAPDSARAAEVTEVDLADYEELERSWTGQIPAVPLARPPVA